MTRKSGLAALLLLGGCGEQPAGEPTAAPAIALPQEVCEATRRNLEALKGRAAIDYDDRGAATISQDVWLAMPADQREGLASALGYHAGCAAPEPLAEKEVAISSEYGTVLMRRTITLSVDPMTLLAD